MDRYVIERTLPGAGSLSQAELHDISAKSNEVLADLGVDVSWVQSYVTEDKLYCIYDATDPELIKKHAEMGGFPCDSVKPVSGMLSPENGR